MYDEETQARIIKAARELCQENGTRAAAYQVATQRAIKERSEFWASVAAFLSDG